MEQATVAKSGPGYPKHPGYSVDIVPAGRNVRVVFNGETIVDSDKPFLVLETQHAPVYYFRREDVRMDLARRTEHKSFCPFKGDASYWDVSVAGKTEENVFWSYESPFAEVPEIKDLIGMYWHKMDAWYEDGVEVNEASGPRSPS